MIEFAASLYVLLSAGAIGFQLALAGGSPWGHLANGGRFPGQLPPAMRVAAVVQAGVLAMFALVLASKGGLIFPETKTVVEGLQWWVVGFCGLSLAANLATPSLPERRLWAPVAGLMLASSLVVAGG